MTNKTDSDIIEEARERWELSENMLSDERALMLEDIKFSIGNSDNGFQWHDTVKLARKASGQPMFTLNKMPQFINQVVNDARENPAQVKIRPVDGGADKDSADILNGICRNIENSSQADIAYDTALEHAARCGMGYFRLRADYLDYRSFNQDLIIDRIADPLSVRLDPYFTKADGADAKWGFIESSMHKKQFEADYKDIEASSWEGANDWADGESVRVVEYYRVVEKEQVLLQLSDGTTIYEGEAMPAGLSETARRKGKRCEVEWYKLTAVNIIDRIMDKDGKPSALKLSELPIYPVIGNETYIEGKPMRSGLVRNSKDSQRIYNYEATLEIEVGALAPKAPFIGYEGQFADKKWLTANHANHPYLETKIVDVNGERLPLPQRQGFAGVPSGILQAKQGANQDIRETMGIYQASNNLNSSEMSGRAILAKQKEGDTGTFHYRDNLARAESRLYRNIIEMIPSYYDVARIARILGEDGSTSEVHIDPNAPQALSKVKDNKDKIKRIFNPNIGRYDVVVTIGASYATQRMEAAESQLELARVIPQIAQVAPDIMARSFDFKGADELADRLKATLPPGLVQDDEQEKMPPQVQQAIQQVQQTVQIVEQHKQELMAKEQELAQTGAQVQAEMDKLAASKQVFDAQVKLAKTELENQSMKVQQAMQNDKASAETEQTGAYVAQLEQMVQDLSQAVEESQNEQETEQTEAQESTQNQLLAESLAKLTQVVEKLANPVRKIGTATKDPITGNVTLSVVEIPQSIEE